MGSTRTGTSCAELRGGATGGDCSETGEGERHSSDLAQAWALAERDDGQRNREHRLKRRDH